MLICMHHHYLLAIQLTEATTIRVSKRTAESLENTRKRLKADSLDETIQLLIKKQRKAVLESAYGVARDQIKPFTEEDRGEDRN